MSLKKIIEYGDFQTPLSLAREIAELLAKKGLAPNVVVEPTCGEGSFLQAAVSHLKSIRHVYGFDINPAYVAATRSRLEAVNDKCVTIHPQDFFQQDWAAFFQAIPDNVLVLGNPPWVTNAALGVLQSGNLPEKSNFQNETGFSAKTGKANFDISEWMLIRLLEGLQNRNACLAMLCKTGTARKTLRYAWLHHLAVYDASMHLIDAGSHFGVSVSACLLIVHTGQCSEQCVAPVYADLSFGKRLSLLGLAGGELVADVKDYDATRAIDGVEYYKWRSGVKHDAASIMEFTREGDRYVNGLGDRCELEEEYLYPLLKSSDLANNRLAPNRFVLLTQRRTTDPTETICSTAPKTWAYLLRHAKRLDGRKSIIYRRRPRFSVFGVGDYTFTPWKVAVAGLYKNIRFCSVGSSHGKPFVPDDTCYFVPCKTEQEARLVSELLNSDLARRFIHSLVFFDSKRPINAEVLRRIDLMKIAEQLGRSEDAGQYLADAAFEDDRQQLLVFRG
ncbi:MAG TPA: N-6 DNA methylase [Thermoguttaceae bacterium]|nr:N-6 DNA methylase [Thermoguttaceae bacterium]